MHTAALHDSMMVHFVQPVQPLLLPLLLVHVTRQCTHSCLLGRGKEVQPAHRGPPLSSMTVYSATKRPIVQLCRHVKQTPTSPLHNQCGLPQRSAAYWDICWSSAQNSCACSNHSHACSHNHEHTETAYLGVACRLAPCWPQGASANEYDDGGAGAAGAVQRPPLDRQFAADAAQPQTLPLPALQRYMLEDSAAVTLVHTWVTSKPTSRTESYRPLTLRQRARLTQTEQRALAQSNLTPKWPWSFRSVEKCVPRRSASDKCKPIFKFVRDASPW